MASNLHRLIPGPIKRWAYPIHKRLEKTSTPIGKFTPPLAHPPHHKSTKKTLPPFITILTKPNRTQRKPTGSSTSNYTSIDAQVDLKAILGKSITQKFTETGDPILTTYAGKIIKILKAEGILSKKGRLNNKVKKPELEMAIKKATKTTVSEILSKYYPQSDAYKLLQTIEAATQKLSSRIKKQLTGEGLSANFNNIPTHTPSTAESLPVTQTTVQVQVQGGENKGPEIAEKLKKVINTPNPRSDGPKKPDELTKEQALKMHDARLHQLTKIKEDPELEEKGHPKLTDHIAHDYLKRADLLMTDEPKPSRWGVTKMLITAFQAINNNPKEGKIKNVTADTVGTQLYNLLKNETHTPKAHTSLVGQVAKSYGFYDKYKLENMAPSPEKKDLLLEKLKEFGIIDEYGMLLNPPTFEEMLMLFAITTHPKSTRDQKNLLRTLFNVGEPEKWQAASKFIKNLSEALPESRSVTVKRPDKIPWTLMRFGTGNHKGTLKKASILTTQVIWDLTAGIATTVPLLLIKGIQKTGSLLISGTKRLIGLQRKSPQKKLLKHLKRGMERNRASSPELGTLTSIEMEMQLLNIELDILFKKTRNKKTKDKLYALKEIAEDIPKGKAEKPYYTAVLEATKSAIPLPLQIKFQAAIQKLPD